MTLDQQLKLQAFLDGELSEAESRDVAAWIAGDPEATALHKELKHTRQALTGHEAGIKVPESREFYWSKIEREIIRQQPRTEAAVQEDTSSGWLLRWLVPATTFAIVTITAMLAAKHFGLLGPANVAVASSDVEMSLSDPGAFTYRDDQEGVTVVWLSYGENGLANGDDAGSIQ